MICQVQGSMNSFLKFLSKYNVDKLETTSEGIEELFFSYYSTSHLLCDQKDNISK